MLTYATPKGNPHLIPTGAPPTFAADGSDISDWLQAGRSFRRFTTQALLGTATGMANRDLALVDAIPGAWFIYNGSTGRWVMSGVPEFPDATARSAAITAPFYGNRSILTNDPFDWRYSGSAWVRSGPTATGIFGRTTDVNSTTTAAAIPFQTATSLVGLSWAAGNPTRIAVTAAGRYLVSGTWQQNTTGTATFYCRVNGTAETARVTATNIAGATAIMAAFSVEVVAGDYIEVMVLVSAGPYPWVGNNKVYVDSLSFR